MTRRAIAMAMHIHASFSEGTASYEAHLQQAREHGVDVIWWTDHDFRVAAHHHRQAVGFDGLSEFEGELEWTWAEQREGALADARAEFVDQPTTSDEPGRAMRLWARGGPGGGALWQAATAWNWTYSINLADTTLELDVLPEEVSAGAALVFEIASSYHPARGGRPAGQYTLRYRIGADEPGWHADGLAGTVDLAAPVGEWTRLVLRPVDDFARLWPDLVASDNSLHQLRLGVTVADTDSASFVVDRLRFDRGKGAGAAGMELRREVLSHYAEEYPDVTHHEAFEVSLVRHLNWFGGELTLPRLPSPPFRDNDPELMASMVEFMHARGAVVQWNHPLDVETPESLAQLMIERDAFGVDLVEIGREPFDGLLQVFDTAARNAIFFTATGVSDDHAGRDWLDQRSNWITCVWAHSTSVPDLTDALRAGNAWFCDPARWRGELDIRLDERSALGRVLVTDAASVPVRFVLTNPPADGQLELILGTVDRAGVGDPSPHYDSQLVPATDAPGAGFQLDVEPGDGRYVRTQLRAADGTIIAVSNPAWLLREPPPAGIPDARRL